MVPKVPPAPVRPRESPPPSEGAAEPPVGLETISLQLGRGEAPPHLLPGFLSRGLCSCGSLRTGRPSSPLCPVRPSSFRRCELLPHQTAPLSPAGARGGRPFQQDEGCARVISAGPRDAGGDPPLSLGRGIPAPRTGLGSATAPLRTPRPPGLEQPDSGAFSCPSRVTEPFLDSGLVLTGCGLVSRAPLGSLRSPHLPVSISRLPPITAQASQCRHQQPITASADRSGSGVGTPLLPLIPRGCPPPPRPSRAWMTALLDIHGEPCSACKAVSCSHLGLLLCKMGNPAPPRVPRGIRNCIRANSEPAPLESPPLATWGSGPTCPLAAGNFLSLSTGGKMPPSLPEVLL